MRRQARNASSPPRNMAQNGSPSMRPGGQTGWGTRGGAGVIVTADARLVGPEAGARVIASAAGQNPGFTYSDRIDLAALGLAPGDVCWADVQSRPGWSISVNIGLRFYDATGASVGSSVTGSLSGGRTTLTVSNVTIPAGAVTAEGFSTTGSATTAAGQFLDFDGFRFGPGATPPAGSYAPGNMVPARAATKAASARPDPLPAGPLPYKPPVLTNPLVFTVDPADGSSFNITVPDGRDALVVLPPTPITGNPAIGDLNAAVVITNLGSGAVKVIGGCFRFPATPPARLTGSLTAADTTITVDDISVIAARAGTGPGNLRIEGELVKYTSIDVATNRFLGCTRQAGFYNNAAGASIPGIASNTTHSAGASVCIGENARSAVAFVNQTGPVYMEGVLFDGFLCDGGRILRSVTTGGQGVVTFQNCHFTTGTGWDGPYATDGHADNIQIVGGPAELRLARCTFITDTGRCLNNKGTDQSVACGKITVIDCEFIARSTQGAPIASADTATTWDVTRSYLVSPGGLKGVVDTNGATVTAVDQLFTRLKTRQVVDQICPATSVGLGYVNTLGYAA